VAYDAYHGTGAYTEAPFPALRSVLALHSELVKSSRGQGYMNSVISPANASWLGWREAAQGRPERQWSKRSDGKDGQTPRTLDMPTDAIGNALCKGSIDASLLVLGHPSGKIRDLLAGCALNLVPVDGPAIDALVAALPI
jgi:uncharacterized protein